MSPSSWLFEVTVLCLCTGYLTAEDRNPGVRVRITQRGLNYGSELAVDMLMKNKDEIKISDIYISVAGSSMVLSNIAVRHLPRPNLRLSLVPTGRLRADVTQLHPIVDANMRITYQTWLFSSSREGSITATGRNMAIMLEATLDVDDAGRPVPRDWQCRANGDIQIALTGRFRRWSRLFRLVYNTLQSRLKPTIFSELCVNVLRDVNVLVANELVNVPMSVELDNDFVFDYRLTTRPRITSQFLETSHKGEIYLQSNRSEPPFEPPVIPAFPRHTDKMAYLYVTEYVANSGWHALLSSGQDQLTVHENTTSIPEAARRFLSTSCPGSSCLGSVFPRLAVLYPNSAATVNIRVTNSSDRIVRLRRRSVLARVDAVAEIFMQTDRSRDHILTVNLTALVGMNLGFADNRLIFEVTRFNLNTDVQQNSLGLMTSFTEMLFDSFIGMTSRAVIFPTLQLIGLQGVPLIIPTAPELKFINPVVVNHNVPGVMIIGTDIEYTVPEMNTTDSTAV